MPKTSYRKPYLRDLYLTDNKPLPEAAVEEKYKRRQLKKAVEDRELS